MGKVGGEKKKNWQIYLSKKPSQQDMDVYMVLCQSKEIILLKIHFNLSSSLLMYNLLHISAFSHLSLNTSLYIQHPKHFVQYCT